jgi:hypothetical protein
VEPDARSLGRRWAAFLISPVRAILLKFIWAKSRVVLGTWTNPRDPQLEYFFTRTNVFVEIRTEHAIWNGFLRVKLGRT